MLCYKITILLQIFALSVLCNWVAESEGSIVVYSILVSGWGVKRREQVLCGTLLLRPWVGHNFKNSTQPPRHLRLKRVYNILNYKIQTAPNRAKSKVSESLITVKLNGRKNSIVIIVSSFAQMSFFIYGHRKKRKTAATARKYACVYTKYRRTIN